MTQVGESTPRTLAHLSHWGAFSVTVEHDQVIAVEPHPDDPAPMPLIDNVLDAVRHEARVQRPAIRKGWLENGPGASSRRGDDEFVELDWPEALDLLAGELARVRDRHGNESIYGGSYGWASAGRLRSTRVATGAGPGPRCPPRSS